MGKMYQGVGICFGEDTKGLCGYMAFNLSDSGSHSKAYANEELLKQAIDCGEVALSERYGEMAC